MTRIQARTIWISAAQRRRAQSANLSRNEHRTEDLDTMISEDGGLLKEYPLLQHPVHPFLAIDALRHVEVDR
jgi:hypothetical protein